MTYRELDNRANRIARLLRDRGVGPETLVGVAMERSLAMVEALYGILKAGAAYVPLDPEQPAARLGFMLRDANPVVILTQARLGPRLAAAAPELNGRLVALDVEEARLGALPTSAPDRHLEPWNLAYVIYTSGSTGEPKGAMNTHAGIANRLRWMQDEYRLDAADAVLQKTPFSFDVSVWEFFWPLMTGARLVVARPGGHRDPGYLAECVERHGITTLHFVPSMLRSFVESIPSGRCPGLKRVIASGEELTADLRDRFLYRFGAELHNLYGPTEAAVDVSFWPCKMGEGESVPIGRPIANVRLHILDRRMRPVPPGVPGELYIAGVCLARGYWKRPKLTAERFVKVMTTSMIDSVGARHAVPLRDNIMRDETLLYRTGDLARYRADGAIEYLGRLDHQVKIRGFRIELGEIEAALRDCDGVTDAVVMARELGGEKELVAWIASSGGPIPAEASLRTQLRARLPEAMVPARFVVLDRLPLMANGKIDRKGLPDPSATVDQAALLPRGTVEELIAAAWREVLGLEAVGADENFFDVGGHSLRMIRVHARLVEHFGPSLTLVELFEHPTIRRLARHLSQVETRHEQSPGRGEPESRRRARIARRRQRELRDGCVHDGPGFSGGVAVVGMACRFPGARTIDEYWRNLRDGVESVRFFTDEELLAAGEDPALMARSEYVRAYAPLPVPPEEFDAGFFDYSPREAELIDPQQRLFLEVAKEALEAAGLDPARAEGTVGVFAGAAMNTYLLHNIATRPEIIAAAGGFQVMITNDKDYLATRVSYKLDLKGPSVNVQTACSTSLVAIALACESLERGECDAALAGGVSVRVPQVAGYLYEEGMIFSPDGHCRAFDEKSAGIVSGSGAGAVLLKRLEDAIADGDEIRAVIRGAAINNDGSVKAGFTAPSVEGQAAAIAAALEKAHFDPAAIGYVEAHGTGTPIGDPIEIAALGKAWRARGGDGRTEPCPIGSVKTNIGHLDAAAGVAGFIKAVLAVERGSIPPSLHFTAPNPRLDLAAGPFRVNGALSAWPEDRPRIAAVSSFGLGGTNAHVILEAPPSRPWSAVEAAPRLLVLSARTPEALERLTDDLAAALADEAAPALEASAWTLATGRRRHPYGRIAVVRESGQAAEVLRRRDPERIFSRHEESAGREVVFAFSGQGGHYEGMASGLYRSNVAFRRAFDACAERAAAITGLDPRHVLFGEDGRSAGDWSQQESQPAFLSMQVALARFWMEAGIVPDLLIGHSGGDFAAACIAGVLSLDEALRVVHERGRLMDSTPEGALVAVLLGRDELRPLLPDDVHVAAVNSPGLCVISGSRMAVERFVERLESKGIETHAMPVRRAAHSPLLDPIIEEFAGVMAGVTLNAPRIPMISNLAGRILSEAEARDPRWWARHLREPVRFMDGLVPVLSVPDRIVIEVGPGRGLANAVIRHPARQVNHLVLTSLPPGNERRDDQEHLLASIGEAWMAGVEPDWTGLFEPAARRKVVLPGHPLERKRYWIDPAPVAGLAGFAAKRRAPETMISMPSWARSAPLPADEAYWRDRACLVVGRGAASESLVALLVEHGAVVAVLPPEDSFESIPRVGGREPETVFHAGLLGDMTTVALDVELEQGFFSLFRLVQALAAGTTACRIEVLTSGLHRVVHGDPVRPGRAAILGLVRVVPQENANLSVRNIDLAAEELSSRRSRERLLAEAASAPLPAVVCLRGEDRWQETLAPVADTAALSSFRDEGVYLVTGGLGGIGLELSRAIAEGARAPRLVLVSRRGLPDDPEDRRVGAVRSLERCGAVVEILEGDIGDAEWTRRLVASLVERHGRLDGVIHAAGIAGGGLVAARTRESVEEEFRAKVHGTAALVDALAVLRPDFIALSSSTNALVGGVGQAAYVAAAAYMDALAEERGLPVVSINWYLWQGIGMAVESARLHRQFTGHEFEDGITAEEGRAIFRRVLARGLSRIVASPVDMNVAMRDSRRFLLALDRSGRPASIDEGQAVGERAAPEGEIEETIAAAWREVLGLEHVGRDDEFGRVGGDSLIAVRLASRLRERLETPISVRTIYEEPSVARLARFVEASRWAASGGVTTTEEETETGTI